MSREPEALPPMTLLEAIKANVCVQCRRAGSALCFDCFVQRPFVRDVVCNRCEQVKPIVRMFLKGNACDDCALELGWSKP